MRTNTAASRGSDVNGISKWKLLQANWSYQSRQFFETSTLHGVRYISEKGRPFHERLLWFISTTGGLMAALVIVDSLWDKFQTSPTITGLDTDYHSWDVPFPALTLCMKDRANKTLVDQYIDEAWPDADEDAKIYYSNFLNALTNISYSALPNLLPFIPDTKLPQKNLRKLVFSLYSHCQEFTQCAYKNSIEEMLEQDGHALNCCDMLFPVFTENGLCFAFNLNYTLKDWPWHLNRPTFTESYIEETDTRWSFTFDSANPFNNSIAVYISSSYDMPGGEVNPQHIWNKRVSKLLFVPKMTYTVDDARQLSIKQRGCVFHDEIKLRVADIYTFSSCMRQCRMDRIVKRCGCLPFFYSSLPGQRHCELRELKCVIHHLDEISTTKLHCPCPLSCEHTVYEMEKPHEAGGDAGSETSETEGVEVGFLSWPLTRYKREVLFGQVDLLVAIGTIAGLFLGFSLLSGVEIIYLFTLRAWCMMHTDREYLEELAVEYSRKEVEPVDLTLRPSFLKGEVEGVRTVSPRGDNMADEPYGQKGPPMWKSIQYKNNKNKIVDAGGLFPYTQ